MKANHSASFSRTLPGGNKDNIAKYDVSSHSNGYVGCGLTILWDSSYKQKRRPVEYGLIEWVISLPRIACDVRASIRLLLISLSFMLREIDCSVSNGRHLLPEKVESNTLRSHGLIAYVCLRKSLCSSTLYAFTFTYKRVNIATYRRAKSLTMSKCSEYQSLRPHQ